MFNLFIQWLYIQKGLQTITVKGYVNTIKRIVKKFGKIPNNKELKQYIYEFYSSNYSYSYKKNTALAIEKYTEFLEDPLKFGRQKKPYSIIKDTLTESEVTKLIFSCKNIKEKSIVSLLAYSGIRNKELCNLKVKDFDAGRNTIRIIQGKGLKDGISMISAECTKILLEYLEKYQPKDFFFYTYQGNQYTGYALRKLVKVISKRAGIDKRVYPHLLRHSLAVNMFIRGADIVTLKQQLRHSLLETTLIYLNSIVFGERNNYEKSAPSYI